MKHKCIISRLNEPHIARVYVLDLDQNLINNIRVLCTNMLLIKNETYRKGNTNRIKLYG